MIEAEKDCKVCQIEENESRSRESGLNRLKLSIWKFVSQNEGCCETKRKKRILDHFLNNIKFNQIVNIVNLHNTSEKKCTTRILKHKFNDITLLNI